MINSLLYIGSGMTAAVCSEPLTKSVLACIVIYESWEDNLVSFLCKVANDFHRLVSLDMKYWDLIIIIIIIIIIIHNCSRANVQY